MLCHVSVHSGALCLRQRARDPISVAFFDRVALFSDFNHLFELLDRVLLLTAVVPFIYWNYAKKNILNTLTAKFMNNFHVGNVFSHTKPWSRMQSLSESRGGCKVTNLFLVIVESASPLLITLSSPIDRNWNVRENSLWHTKVA